MNQRPDAEIDAVAARDVVSDDQLALRGDQFPQQKLPYVPPTLVREGTVRQNTLGGGSFIP